MGRERRERYSLVGAEAGRAVAAGLSGAQWFRSAVPRARMKEGAFFASDGHCTHERTLLCDGLVMDGLIECPLHNGQFDIRTGQAKGAPVIVELRTYPTKVEDGTVHIRIG